MTISSQTRKAGPFIGNGSTTAFPFSFKVFATSDLVVTRANTLSVESTLVLGTDYTVSLNGNQNTNPGGTVTLTSALTINFKLVLTSAVPNLQPVDITNNGGFYPKVINDALDRVTILVQQNALNASRGFQVPITSDLTAEELTDQLFEARDEAVASASAAAASAGTASTGAGTATTQAGIATTQAGIATTQAGIATTQASNALSSANSAAASAASAATQAGIATTQAGIATTQASNALSSANSASASESTATTQASNALSSANSAAASAASAATALDSFDDRYLGSKTDNPTLDNDGNALVQGALYYRSTAPIGMKVYDGAQWIEASAAQQASLVTFEYVATAGQTVFSGVDANGVTLSYTVDSILVSRNGLRLRPGDDFTATNGTSVVLLVASTLSDKLIVDSFRTFDIANTYTKAEVDSIFNVNFGQFRKANPDVVAFSKTGNFTVSTATQLFIEVNGVSLTIASGTAVAMPAATTGTDYAIWAKPGGTLEATSNHSTPPIANSRKVGGFHYAPGGNAAAQSGGNTTAQINEYSFWDLKYRPSAPDPRGMTLVAGVFWIDIYLTGVDAITNGSSKYNVTMADGVSPPKVPTMFGGNGSTTYGSYTWFEAMELGTAFGKRCPTQQEFMSAMYGTTEASSIGTDQNNTILNATYTSRWGVMQSSGVLYVWGRERAGPYASAAWNANTEGRGSEYNAPNACRLGGGWLDGVVSGSRCSFWSLAASVSSDNIGSRFSCDHLQLD